MKNEKKLSSHNWRLFIWFPIHWHFTGIWSILSLEVHFYAPVFLLFLFRVGWFLSWASLLRLDSSLRRKGGFWVKLWATEQSQGHGALRGPEVKSTEHILGAILRSRMLLDKLAQHGMGFLRSREESGVSSADLARLQWRSAETGRVRGCARWHHHMLVTGIDHHMPGRGPAVDTKAEPCFAADRLETSVYWADRLKAQC